MTFYDLNKLILLRWSQKMLENLGKQFALGKNKSKNSFEDAIFYQGWKFEFLCFQIFLPKRSVVWKFWILIFQNFAINDQLDPFGKKFESNLFSATTSSATNAENFHICSFDKSFQESKNLISVQLLKLKKIEKNPMTPKFQIFRWKFSFLFVFFGGNYKSMSIKPIKVDLSFVELQIE